MKRSTLVAIAIAAVIVIAAVAFLSTRDSDTVGETASTTAASPEKSSAPGATVSPDELLQPGPVPDMAIGDAAAPVTVIEYASLTCSHCKEFHDTTFPEVKKRYIDTGKVRFIYRDFPLDEFAMAGSMLARCGNQDKYFPVVDAFFEKQPGLGQAEKPFEWLQSFGKQVGYTQESFEACLSNQGLMDNLMAVRQRASEKFGVSSTPTFFINGQIKRGAMSIDEFEKELEPFLKK